MFESDLCFFNICEFLDERDLLHMASVSRIIMIHLYNPLYTAFWEERMTALNIDIYRMIPQKTLDEMYPKRKKRKRESNAGDILIKCINRQRHFLNPLLRDRMKEHAREIQQQEEREKMSICPHCLKLDHKKLSESKDWCILKPHPIFPIFLCQKCMKLPQYYMKTTMHINHYFRPFNFFKMWKKSPIGILRSVKIGQHNTNYLLSDCVKFARLFPCFHKNKK